MKSFIIMSIGPIGSALLSFITLPILAATFQPAVVAEYSIFLTVSSLATTIVGYELYQSYVREYYEYRHILSTFVPSNFAPVLFIYTIFLFFVLFFGDWFSANVNFYNIEHFSFLISSFVLCGLLIQIFSHLVRMEGDSIQFSIGLVLPKLTFLLFVLMVVVGSANYGVELILLSLLLANALSVLYYVFICKNFPSIKQNFSFDSSICFKSLKFSTPLIFTSLIVILPTTLDKLFLAHYSSLEDVAVYTVVSSIAGGLTLLSVLASNIWHPWLYKIHGAGEFDIAHINSILTVLVFCIALLWSASWVISWTLLYFLPSHYSSAPFLLSAYIACPLLSLLSEFTVVGVALSRKTLFIFLAALGGCTVCLILYFFLIPAYLTEGAVLSLVIGSLVLFFVRTEASAQLLNGLCRSSIYSVVLIYFTLSCYILLTRPSFLVVVLCSFGSFFTVLYIYRSNIICTFRIIKSIFAHRAS